MFKKFSFTIAAAALLSAGQAHANDPQAAIAALAPQTLEETGGNWAEAARRG